MATNYRIFKTLEYEFEDDNAVNFFDIPGINAADEKRVTSTQIGVELNEVRYAVVQDATMEFGILIPIKGIFYVDYAFNLRNLTIAPAGDSPYPKITIMLAGT